MVHYYTVLKVLVIFELIGGRSATAVNLFLLVEMLFATQLSSPADIFIHSQLQ